jgi:hypothetical protein
MPIGDRPTLILLFRVIDESAINLNARDVGYLGPLSFVIFLAAFFQPRTTVDHEFLEGGRQANLWKGCEIFTLLDTQHFKRGEVSKAFGRQQFQIVEAYDGEATKRRRQHVLGKGHQIRTSINIKILKRGKPVQPPIYKGLNVVGIRD